MLHKEVYLIEDVLILAKYLVAEQVTQSSVTQPWQQGLSRVTLGAVPAPCNRAPGPQRPGQAWKHLF